MRRRNLIAAIGGAALACPFGVAAQQTDKVYQIGILGVAAPTAEVLRLSVDPFKEGLRERGWVEGKNIIIEFRWAEGRNERLPELAAELVGLGVDLIATSLDDGVRAASRATQTVPIVGANMSERIRPEVARGFAQPGGNVTGLTSEAGPMIVAKNLEFLKEALPSVQRVAVLVNPVPGPPHDWMNDFGWVADTLKVDLQVTEVHEAQDLAHAFARAKDGGANSVHVVGTGMFFLHRDKIAELALAHGLPTSCDLRGLGRAGCLINYTVDIADNWRRAASYVDRILKGAKPGDLPIEQPTKFELVINLKTAKALGIEIPASLLARADEVIE